VSEGHKYPLIYIRPWLDIVHLCHWTTRGWWMGAVRMIFHYNQMYSNVLYNSRGVLYVSNLIFILMLFNKSIQYWDMKGPSIEQLCGLRCICKFEHILLTWNATKVGSHNDHLLYFSFVTLLLNSTIHI
jgi:hypothetical protein